MPVITRQYTPPTCSLEVTAQISALSRWTRRPVVKSLDFLLSFKGLSDETLQPIEVRGNREQLEQLSMAVNAYVQDFMGHRSHTLPWSSPATAAATHTTALQGSGAVVPSTPTISPYLHPQSLLTHTLFLGPLASNGSSDGIPLQVSQLFDLVSALEEYAQEVDDLPTLVPPSTSWVQKSPVWARAAGAVVLVGGTATALQLSQVLEFGGVADQVATVDETTTVRPQPSRTPVVRASPTATTALLPPSPSPRIQLPRRQPGLGTFPADAPGATAPPGPPAGPLTPPARRRSPTTTSIPSLATPEISTPQVPELVIPTPKAPTVLVPVEKAVPDRTADSATRATPQVASAPVPDATTQPPQQSAPTLIQPAAPSAFQAAARDSLGASSPSERNTISLRIPTDLRGQVDEARRILSQRWQAPPGLRRTLEYRLRLNGDGSVNQVVPLGQAAQEYLNQTPMPRLPRPFVSPRLNNAPSKLRVVFSANGVQVLPDPSR